MSRLPHGYTNRTRHTGDGRVEKVFEGSRRRERAATELACLEHLATTLPVPLVLGHDDVTIVTAELEGMHGQDLIDRGRARDVLTLVGAMLVRLHRVPPAAVAELSGSGDVIVHGDFGPQNLLVDLDHGEVTGILDWEFAHVGDRVEDLAWAEWVVRMHHRAEVEHLDALFSAAQLRPSPEARHRAMLRRCDDLLGECIAAGDAAAIEQWRTRRRITAGWRLEA